MDILYIVLAIIGTIIGFLIGKYIYDKAKWADKKRAIEAEWKLKLEKLEGQGKLSLEKLDGKYQKYILELKKENELTVKKLAHGWELKYTNDLAEIKELIQSTEKYLRQDAVRRSKRTLLGKLWEQVSPYLPKFPFKPSDMRFLGSPIDFIIFDGAAENDIKQVIFLEVKSGDSKLSSQEKKLKEAIEEGKVSWKLFNVEKPEKIKLQELEEKETMLAEVAPPEVYRNIDEKIAMVKSEKDKDEEEDEELEEEEEPEEEEEEGEEKEWQKFSSK